MKRLILLFCLSLSAVAQTPKELAKLADDFWAWRAAEQPFSGDDIPRIVRPAGWKADWSPAAVARYRKDLVGFEQRWKALGYKPGALPRPAYVDYRLIGSAIARVRWDLEYVRGWQRNPYFYYDQTVGSIHILLLQPPPFDETRSAEIVRRLDAVPKTIEFAKANLQAPSAQMGEITITALKDIHGRMAAVARELRPYLNGVDAAQLDAAADRAGRALEDYRAWLEQQRPKMSQQKGVGREAYLFFLRKVALVPYEPVELQKMARQEWERSVAFEAYEQAKNAKLPPLRMARDQAEQIEWEAKDEAQVRARLTEAGILTIPEWMHHYLNLPLPKYLAPIAEGYVNADHTGPGRLDEDGTSYISPPSPDNGYFAVSTARDPRPIILHEGVPGHYFQLSLGWAHEDPIRRHYYDSGVNEGIGLYSEELGLQAGIFDDSPRSREIIYNFMRLRALRVEVDVKLALGEFSLQQAAEYFVTRVPMDPTTARDESGFYVTNPGVAIAYQTGKLQILKLIAEIRVREGEHFDLRKVHDFIWKNGNVPLSLQRYELSGATDELGRLDKPIEAAAPAHRK